jgi:L-fucose isomerase-like protein
MHAFGHVTVASPLHDPATVDRLVADVVAGFDALGGAALTSPEDRPGIPLVVVVATGGTEAAILDVVRRRHAVVPYEPVLLVAHPRHNSLPAALEAMARIQQDGSTGRIVQVDGPLGDGARDRPVADAADHELVTAVRDVAAIHRLHGTRLGLVGQPSHWLVASVPDAIAIRSRWGVTIVDVDIRRTIADHATADPDAAHEVAVRFVGRGGATVTPELERAAAVHPALVAAIDRDRLDAVAVRCFDFLGDLQTSGCVALAELNDTGTVAGCEGDVAGTMAMLMARTLLDRPSWIANPAHVDTASNRLLLAHCTVAPSLVDDVELHTHFESGIGIGLRGSFRPGPVTLLRLGGRQLERYWIAEGHVEATGTSPDLCRTQVDVQVLDTDVATLLDEPLGNHLVMIHGHHRGRIERWWKLAFPARNGQPAAWASASSHDARRASSAR